MRTLIVWSIGSLVILWAAAALADNDALLKAIESNLQRADPQPVRKLLTASVREALAAVPADAAVACSWAAIYARTATEETSDPEDMVPILDAFLEIGSRCIELHPHEADAHVALARARSARCRHRLAESGTVQPDEWRAVADAWLGATRCPYGEKRVLDALRALIEGAWAKSEHRQDLFAAAEAIGREHLKPGKDTPYARYGLAETRFAQARHAYGAKNRDEATAAAREAQTLLEGLHGESSPVYERAYAALNRIACFLRESKLDRKAPFRTYEEHSRWKLMTFELPRGSHWKVEHETDDDAQTLTTLSRWDIAPSVGKTVISMHFYKRWTDYTGDGKEVGGDNPRGLLEWERDDDMEWLHKVTRHRKLLRGKLNRGIRKTCGYEMWGEHESGTQRWIRTWYFKSVHRKYTYRIRISRYGPDPGMDPEVQHILDSIREVPEEE